MLEMSTNSTIIVFKKKQKKKEKKNKEKRAQLRALIYMPS